MTIVKSKTINSESIKCSLRKRHLNNPALLVATQNSADAMEDSMEFSKRIKINLYGLVTSSLGIYAET